MARGASSSLQRRSSWLWWPLSLWSAGSGSRGLSGVACGPRAQAQLPCGLWDLPRPGVRPVSPVVAGGFLPAVSPEKFSGLLLKDNFTGYRILCWWVFFSLNFKKYFTLFSSCFYPWLPRSWLYFFYFSISRCFLYSVFFQDFFL